MNVETFTVVLSRVEYVESSTYSSRILEYAMSSTRLNTTETS